jgi:hypothetical protein
LRSDGRSTGRPHGPSGASCGAPRPSTSPFERSATAISRGAGSSSGSTGAAHLRRLGTAPWRHSSGPASSTTAASRPDVPGRSPTAATATRRSGSRSRPRACRRPRLSRRCPAWSPSPTGPGASSPHAAKRSKPCAGWPRRASIPRPSTMLPDLRTEPDRATIGDHASPDILPAYQRISEIAHRSPTTMTTTGSKPRHRRITAR